MVHSPCWHVVHFSWNTTGKPGNTEKWGYERSPGQTLASPKSLLYSGILNRSPASFWPNLQNEVYVREGRQGALWEDGCSSPVGAAWASEWWAGKSPERHCWDWHPISCAVTDGDFMWLNSASAPLPAIPRRCAKFSPSRGYHISAAFKYKQFPEEEIK